MWSLIDIRKSEEPCADITKPPCFPVQTASPERVRYKNFLKVNNVILTGLPLWTREELALGYVLQFYISFII